MLKLRENSKISTLHWVPCQLLSVTACLFCSFSDVGTSDCLNPSQPKSNPIWCFLWYFSIANCPMSMFQKHGLARRRHVKSVKLSTDLLFASEKLGQEKCVVPSSPFFFNSDCNLQCKGKLHPLKLPASSVARELNAAVKAAVILLDHRNFDCWPWLLRPLWLLHPWWKRMHCEQKILQPLLKL